MALLETSGIGGSGASSLQPTSTSLTPASWEVSIHTPVRTLADLKNVLIEHMGEKKGMQLYNFFLSSIVTASVTQMQQSSQAADQAAKGMSDTSS